MVLTLVVFVVVHIWRAAFYGTYVKRTATATGLESIKSRPEEDRSLPVGSRGKNPAEFRKYGPHSKHIQLDSDLSWTDARKAADILIKTCPPLTADLTANQRLGYDGTNYLNDTGRFSHCITFHLAHRDHIGIGKKPG